MMRFCQLLTAVAVVAAVLSVATVCPAQQELIIFSGDFDKAEAGAWGAGTAELTDEQTYLEREVLEIGTKGFHQGGRLHLKMPADMGPYLSAPEKSFLVLIVKIHQAEVKAAQQGPGGPGGPPMEGPGMMPPGDPGMLPPGGPPGGPPMPPAGPAGHGPPMPPAGPAGHGPPMPPAGPGGPGGPMGPEPGMEMPPDMAGPPGAEGTPGQGQKAPEAPPPMVTKLRALLVTDKGQIDSGAIEILRAEDALEDWYTMLIPLAQFAGEGKDPEAKLEDIAIFGDVEEKFWIATVKIVSETDPLIADAGEQRIVKVDEDVEFVAQEQKGSARVQYLWDFDDWDGIAEDSIGSKVKWTFTEAGFYVVTLTVKDRTGRRLTRTAHVDVKVEE